MKNDSTHHESSFARHDDHSARTRGTATSAGPEPASEWRLRWTVAGIDHYTETVGDFDEIEALYHAHTAVNAETDVCIERREVIRG